MKINNFYAQDLSGNALGGASCYVYRKGTRTTVSITDASGISMAQPFLTLDNGLCQFVVADGDYDLRVISGDLDYTISFTSTSMMSGGIGIATGTDSIVVSYSNPINQLISGSEYKFYSAGENSGPVTIDFGTGIYPLVGQSGIALQGGEISGLTSAVYDQDNNRFILNKSLGRIQIVDASQSHHAVSLGQLNSLQAYLENELKFPAGTVIYSASSSAPIGFLKANGAAISRAVYSTLFSVIGTKYGSGDGSTTFNLPDFRGEFIRSWDDGRGVDSGRSLGSWQDYSTAAPKTTTPQKMLGDGTNTSLDGATNPSRVGFVRPSKSGESVTNSGSDSINSGNEMDIINSITGDAETRPRNISQLVCIKY